MTKNLTFDVKYADGTKKEVKEGILFGVDEDGMHMHMHNGTDRKEVLFATVECIFETIGELGLDKGLDKYFNIR